MFIRPHENVKENRKDTNVSWNKVIRTSQVYFTPLSHAQGQLSWCEARDPKGRGLYSRTIARGHVIECEVHLAGPDYFSNTNISVYIVPKYEKIRVEASTRPS